MASGKRDENREVVAMAETNNAARTPTPLQVDPTTKRLLVDISGLDATYVNVTGDTMTGLLQFSGTDHAGIQLINLTTAQRDALTPSEGMIIYNSTLDKVQKYENSVWVDVGMSPATKVVASASSGYAADYYTDGTADDVQIQAAIDAVNTSGGGSVYIKVGTYNINAKVTIPSNITIGGDGFVTILKAVNCFSNTINMLENSDTINGNSNIIVKDLKIDGNRANRTATTTDEQGSNIMYKKCTNCVMENIFSTDSPNVNIILAQGTTFSIVKNCFVTNASNHNLLLLGTSGGIECKKNIVSGNIVTGAGTGLVQGVNIELAIYATYNTITNNVCDSALEGGIHVYYRANHNSIVGNICSSNSQNGISIVDESDYNTISANEIVSSGNGGIVATTADLTYGGKFNEITDNIIYDPAK